MNLTLNLKCVIQKKGIEGQNKKKPSNSGISKFYDLSVEIVQSRRAHPEE